MALDLRFLYVRDSRDSRDSNGDEIPAGGAFVELPVGGHAGGGLLHELVIESGSIGASWCHGGRAGAAVVELVPVGGLVPTAVGELVPVGGLVPAAVVELVPVGELVPVAVGGLVPVGRRRPNAAVVELVPIGELVPAAVGGLVPAAVGQCPVLARNLLTSGNWRNEVPRDSRDTPWCQAPTGTSSPTATGTRPPTGTRAMSPRWSTTAATLPWPRAVCRRRAAGRRAR